MDGWLHATIRRRISDGLPHCYTACTRVGPCRTRVHTVCVGTAFFFFWFPRRFASLLRYLLVRCCDTDAYHTFNHTVPDTAYHTAIYHVACRCGTGTVPVHYATPPVKLFGSQPCSGEPLMIHAHTFCRHLGWLLPFLHLPTGRFLPTRCLPGVLAPPATPARAFTFTLAFVLETHSSPFFITYIRLFVGLILFYTAYYHPPCRVCSKVTRRSQPTPSH